MFIFIFISISNNKHRVRNFGLLAKICHQKQDLTPIKNVRMSQRYYKSLERSLRTIQFLLNRKYQDIMQGVIRNSQKINKTFVFQKQKTHQSVIVDGEVDFWQGYANLNHLFRAYSPLQTNKLSIYDPNSYRFVSLGSIGCQNGYIHRSFLEPFHILFRYHQKTQNQDQPINDHTSYSLGDKEKRDPRSRERTVAEVIQLVKKWRELHMNCFKTPESNKKMNLQQAAKVVNVAKKSLDDYYCQLRLAQMYKFDFKNHLQQKMGVLRGFVKEQRSLKGDKFDKRYKHPKNLKIIDEFDLEVNYVPRQQMGGRGLIKIQSANLQNDVQPKSQQSEEDQQIDEDSLKSPCRQMCLLENEFYKGFQFLLDDPFDPFLQMPSKKSIIDESEGILFF